MYPVPSRGTALLAQRARRIKGNAAGSGHEQSETPGLAHGIHAAPLSPNAMPGVNGLRAAVLIQVVPRVAGNSTAQHGWAAGVRNVAPQVQNANKDAETRGRTPYVRARAADVRALTTDDRRREKTPGTHEKRLLVEGRGHGHVTGNVNAIRVAPVFNEQTLERESRRDSRLFLVRDNNDAAVLAPGAPVNDVDHQAPVKVLGAPGFAPESVSGVVSVHGSEDLVDGVTTTSTGGARKGVVDVVVRQRAPVDRRPGWLDDKRRGENDVGEIKSVHGRCIRDGVAFTCPW